LTSTLSAQEWEWAKTTGQPDSYDYGNNIGIDSENNLYVTGVSKDVCYNCTSNYTNFLKKYSKSGDLLWSQDVDFQEAVSATDRAGNTYVTSGSKLSKYDRHGLLKWSVSEPAAGFNNIALHPNGGVVVSGFQKQISTPLSVIAKYDSTGNQVWITSCSMLATGSRPNIVHADHDGNVFLAGGYDDTASYYKAQLFKFDNQGSQSFVKNIKHNPVSIKTDASGNIYSLGEWFLDKYSSFGILRWRKIFAGPVISLKKIIVKNSDEVVIAGNFSSANSQIKVDNLVLTGNYNLFLMSIDPDGQIINVLQNSETQPSSANSFISFVNDVVSDKNGDIFLTGSFSGQGYLGQTQLLAPQQQPFYNDILLAKAGFNTMAVGISEHPLDAAYNISVFPNPGDRYFTLGLKEWRGKKNLTVVNILGSVVFTEELNVSSDDTEKTIDLYGVKKGVYFIIVEGSEKRESRKIIIQ
jgi:hypothetical protein